MAPKDDILCWFLFASMADVDWDIILYLRYWVLDTYFKKKKNQQKYYLHECVCVYTHISLADES